MVYLLLAALLPGVESLYGCLKHHSDKTHGHIVESHALLRTEQLGIHTTFQKGMMTFEAFLWVGMIIASGKMQL